MADIGQVGFAVEVAEDGRHLHDVAELEELGYSAIWLPGGQIDRPDRVLELLDATASVVVGTAVLSAAVYGPERVVELHRAAEDRAPGRTVLGLGGPQQRRSLAAVEAYLDHLDTAQPPVPAEHRMLAALGPRKLEMAARRSAGPLLLLVTPAYLRAVRADLAATSLVVGLLVVLDEDAERARTTARGTLGFLSGLPGYQAHLSRLGYTDEQVRNLDEALVDDLVARGSPAAVAERVAELCEAGADHVYVQMLRGDDQPVGIDAARRLAATLF
jgi:probable F420-dependent oxidoreductase